MSVVYQGVYLDDSLSSPATISAAALPTFSLKPAVDRATATQVGKSISVEFGYLSANSPTSWYACSDSGVDVVAPNAPTGCNQIVNTGSSLVITTGMLGKYIRVSAAQAGLFAFSATTPIVFAPASAPSQLRMTITATSLRVTWSKPAANFSILSGLKVQLMNSAKKVLKATVLAANASSFMVTAKSLKISFKKGQKFTFQIVSVSSAGLSAPNFVSAALH